MNHSLIIFLQMMRRDFYGYAKKLPTLLFNFCVIYPALFAFSSGYVIPRIYFGTDTVAATLLLAGQVLINVIGIVYSLNIMLLFDLAGDRYIEYQIARLNPRLVLIQRMLFATLFCIGTTLPFFPIAKLLLGNNFVTTNACWVSLIIMICASALACSAYTLFLACYIDNPRNLVRFWLRVNFILISLGGLIVPWHALYQFSPILGTVVLCNPLLYVTEGIRQALVGSSQFLSITTCVSALCVYTLLFIGLALYYFKKRVDHI